MIGKFGINNFELIVFIKIVIVTDQLLNAEVASETIDVVVVIVGRVKVIFIKQLDAVCVYIDGFKITILVINNGDVTE